MVDSYPVVVLGSHRAGTSAVTGLLALSGLELGSVIDPAADNPRGFFESSAVLAADKRILADMGRDWTCPPLRTDRQIDTSAIAAAVEEIRREDRPWGFKEPRSLFLLPYWARHVPGFQFVGVYRPSAAVAASIERRNGFGHDDALAIARSYTDRLRRLHAHLPFPIVRFDSEREEFLDRMCSLVDALGLSWDPDAAEGFIGDTRLHTSSVGDDEADMYLAEQAERPIEGVPLRSSATVVSVHSRLDMASGSETSLYVGPAHEKRRRRLWDAAIDRSNHVGHVIEVSWREHPWDTALSNCDPDRVSKLLPEEVVVGSGKKGLQASHVIAPDLLDTVDATDLALVLTGLGELTEPDAVLALSGFLIDGVDLPSELYVPRADVTASVVSAPYLHHRDELEAALLGTPWRIGHVSVDADDGDRAMVVLVRNPSIRDAGVFSPFELRGRYVELSERADRLEEQLHDVGNRAEESIGALESELESTLGDLKSTRGELESKAGELESKAGELESKAGELHRTRHEARKNTEKAEALAVELSSMRADLGRSHLLAAESAKGVKATESLLKESRLKTARARTSYSRLRNRRSVRVTLRFTALFRPFFRLARRLRRPRDTQSKERAEQTTQSSQREAPDPPIRRQYKDFDDALDIDTRVTLRSHYRATPALAEALVSVIIPTYNRAEELQTAIRSVVEQSHESWELLVVDDGSTDDTQETLEQFASDSRIRSIVRDRGGVSRARNAGLEAAVGDVIAFLDSDNVWDREYLELMIAGLDRTGSDIAYSGMKLVSEGVTVGYRGERFDFDECRKANYVDINVLCHTRAVVDAGNRFDESLRRVNDWDYLLRIARDSEVAFLPFVGATYLFGGSADRISIREPFMYKNIVKYRHTALNGSDRTTIEAREIFRRIGLRFCLQIAAPRDNRNEWGDYHFALAVKQALERRGHAAAIIYRDTKVPSYAEYDVIITLRGLVPYAPVRSKLNVLWSISHPDLLTFEEIDGYDLFFSASLTWPNALAWAHEGSHHTLLQATDRARFYLREPQRGNGEDVLFVGNSRGVDRWIVEQAVGERMRLAIYGAGWKGRVPEDWIRASYLPNESLGRHYGDAAVVLNDHWDSMRHFGYISNRVFDVTAAGGSLVSDDFPGLTRVFGDGVATIRTADELAAAVEKLSHDDRHEARELASWVADHHSFDSRVESLLLHIEDYLFSPEVYTPKHLGESLDCDLCEVAPRLEPTETTDRVIDAASRAPIYTRGAARRLTLGILPQLQPARPAFTSSTYIRLVQPLTTEIDGTALELIRLGRGGRPTSDLDGIDAVVVSRVGVEDRASALQLVECAEELDIPLMVDVDDAFHLMDESHPQFDLYAPRVDALSILLESAQEVWASTVPLAESLRQESGAVVEVVPNSLDYRLWKSFRPEHKDLGFRQGGQLEILYAGTKTHGDDFASIMPVLDELASELDFALTVIGISNDLPDRPWLRALSPRGSALYPLYARWLRRIRGNFDIGIAPLIDTPFGLLKSDIKILEYLALGLIPLASDTGPYGDTPLLDDSMKLGGGDAWHQRLRRLATDAEYRGHQSQAARGFESSMWESRNASTTGADLVARIEAAIDARA